MSNQQIKGEVLLYKTDDGGTRIEVRMVNETVWLSLNQMTDLFDRDKSVIAKHIKNVFEEGELTENRTVATCAGRWRAGCRMG